MIQPRGDFLVPDRKTVLQRKVRLRQKLIRSLERAAEGNDRSFNEEIERRLESSFDFENWREDRQVLMLTLKLALLGDPKGNAEILELLSKMEVADERDFIKHDVPAEVLPLTRKRPRTG
jgi:hypothetical protein